MRAILDFIDEKARELEDSPIMHFLRDERLDPRQRFSFAPCVAPWVFGFSDLNKFVLRDEASQEPLQQLINTHTTEDDFHWQMFLQDLKALEMSDTQDISSTLSLLWGPETSRTRQLVYGLAGLIPTASPVMRLLILKSIEEASEVSFKEAFNVAGEFERLTGRRLSYFGAAHIEMEGDHSMREAEGEAQLAALQLTPQQESEARALVETVFRLVRAMTDELLAYAQRHPRPMPLPAAPERQAG